MPRRCNRYRPRRILFQSTLPVAGERCEYGFVLLALRYRFNPRSPLPGSDAGFSSLGVPSLKGFNPRSPLPGSDALLPEHQAFIVKFQSTLPVAGERCGAAEFAGRQLHAVSIHAPRCRGAMHSWDDDQWVPMCFNPRSPLPGSDATNGFQLWAAQTMFQSTLPVAGERCKV